MLVACLGYLPAAWSLAPSGLFAPRTAGRSAVQPRMQATKTGLDLATWLVDSAGVSPKFIDDVMATCDEQMLGSVENLATLQKAGMLGSIFKPVIAASIEQALGGGSAPAPVAAVNGATARPTLTLSDVKRQLMANHQSTWGTEAELRTRLDMFLKQNNNKLGSWDPSQQSWANSQLPVTTGAVVAAPPVAATAPKPVAAPPAAPAPPPPPPPPPPPAAAAAPVVEAPPAPAPPADPNKSTFTVTLKNPDGDVTFECPPDQFILDEAEEQEIEGADDLPYACRAGSCSACAGKIVSGTMDVGGCGFLDDDQKAAGFVLTCTAKPTSDVVIETHKEEDLF